MKTKIKIVKDGKELVELSGEEDLYFDIVIEEEVGDEICKVTTLSRICPYGSLTGLKILASCWSESFKNLAKTTQK